MAGSSEDRSRRRRRQADLDDEMEEGDIVPRYHSASDTTEYYNNYSSDESDETTSNASSYPVAANNNGNASSSSVAANNYGNSSPSSAVAAPVHACCFCGKEFGSNKAVCGHMKVHVHDRPQGRHEQRNGEGEEVKGNVAVAGSWGVTGKRGCPGSGGTAVSPSAEPDSSMTIMVAEPKLVLQPMPMAFAKTNLSSVPMASAGTDLSGESSRAQPIHNDAMAIVVAGANPPTEAVVHQQAAPPPLAGEQAPLVLQQSAAPPAAGGQNLNGYTCSECNKWFKTHQALGVHVTGHKNRELAAAAAGMPQDGAVPCRRGPKTEKAHVCKMCAREFSKGVQLGGHMRTHWDGPPIVPKKKQRIIQPLPPPAEVEKPAPALTTEDVAQLRFVLPVKAEEASPAPAVEAPQPAPAPAVDRTPEPAPAGPPVTRRVFLFGADIGPGVQTPAAQQGSPGTEGSASTGGQQQ
ncbi:uncharacterized protein LOC133905455 [Phragmites australis]|uniref:uncharacterized protein LOC133905455 n=1 Tax=Phragmites australis TaxID=29695 RepID=UPI002D7A2D9C|nr:uncharacterized protein LOC133905455 [Phragmites australis]